MQASTVDTPTAGHCGTIFVAIELSQKSWLVTLHSPDKDKLSRHNLEGGDHVELLALIGRVRERAARALGAVPTVSSCYEAGYDGFWLHRLLLAAGITNYVFDPASIAVDQRARRVKTDRIDGEKMLRTLMAYLRGEPRVVRIVRVPTPEQEDARRDTRERHRLTKEQTAHTNRIKALLRLHGAYLRDQRVEVERHVGAGVGRIEAHPVPATAHVLLARGVELDRLLAERLALEGDDDGG